MPPPWPPSPMDAVTIAHGHRQLRRRLLMPPQQSLMDAAAAVMHRVRVPSPLDAASPFFFVSLQTAASPLPICASVRRPAAVSLSTSPRSQPSPVATKPTTSAASCPSDSACTICCLRNDTQMSLDSRLPPQPGTGWSSSRWGRRACLPSIKPRECQGAWH